MLQRIAIRSTNPFGKRAHDHQRILEDLEAVEPLLRATSTVEIATTIPVTEVVDALESIARRTDDGTAVVSPTLDTCPASRPVNGRIIAHQQRSPRCSAVCPPHLPEAGVWESSFAISTPLSAPEGDQIAQARRGTRYRTQRQRLLAAWQLDVTAIGPATA
jgi:hypothetical protein